MRRNLIITITFIITFFTSSAYSWEPYNSIVAVVNSIPITQSELNTKFEQVKEKKRIPRSRYAYEKSRVLDDLIENALVIEKAREESIVVNDRRVITQIEKFMKSYFSKRISDEEELDTLTNKLANRLERKIQNRSLKENKKLDRELDSFLTFIKGMYKMDFDTFFEELRIQIRKEQVMSIAIGVSPPTSKDIEAWYRSNINRLGDEIRMRYILMRPRGRSLTAQVNLTKEMNNIRKRILSGESFAKMAKKYSQDPSTKYRGGDTGWVWLPELAQSDRMLAGYVSRLKVGYLSTPFKTDRGYHIIKLLGKRRVSLDKVKRMISYRLYNERLGAQFKKWIARRKRKSDIRIYLEGYNKG